MMLRRLLVASCLWAGCVAAGPTVAVTQPALVDVPDFGANPAGLAMHVYVPADMPATPRPLVVVLYGCTQNPTQYQDAGWSQLAEQWKFYVVYPEQNIAKNDYLSCFNWWGDWPSKPNPSPWQTEPLETSAISRGHQEDESIKEMVDEMKKEHAINDAQVFVAGFSAGAGMASVLLAVWPDVFRGGAVEEGVPYGCAMAKATTDEIKGCGQDYGSGAFAYLTRTAQQWGDLVRAAAPGYSGPRPRVSLWHVASDATINVHNLGELTKQWTDANGIDPIADVEGTVEGFVHKQYLDAQGAALVESYEITGQDGAPEGGHATYVAPGKPIDPAAPGGAGCGRASPHFIDAGICSTYYIARFWGITPAGSPGGGGGGGGASGGGGGGASGGSGGGAGGSGNRGGADGGSSARGCAFVVGATGGATGLVTAALGAFGAAWVRRRKRRGERGRRDARPTP